MPLIVSMESHPLTHTLPKAEIVEFLAEHTFNDPGRAIVRDFNFTDITVQHEGLGDHGGAFMRPPDRLQSLSQLTNVGIAN